MTADVRVPLPPGCYGIKSPITGREYNARPGQTVKMEQRDADLIATSSAGINGILSADRMTGLATRNGRVCSAGCEASRRGRTEQAWVRECRACGAPTQEGTVTA